MRLSRTTRNFLRAAVAIALAFIYIPLIVIAIYAFNGGNTLAWPPPSFTTHWFGDAINNHGARDALITSLKVGAVATLIALILGSVAAFAVARYRFFGRETISFLVVLPIALPGVVTGVALSNTFVHVLGVDLSLLTVIAGHATFCIVVVYNNVIARLRRVSGNLEEASADLGAHTWQTLWHITRPNVQTALVAGGLLAFALSFDEIIVTTFTAGQQTTLPIWMFKELIRPHQRPVTNVAAIIVMAITFVPILLAYYLTRDTQDVAGSGK
jgi:putative spermidine/putrescine transport system permease protein